MPESPPLRRLAFAVGAESVAWSRLRSRDRPSGRRGHRWCRTRLVLPHSSGATAGKAEWRPVVLARGRCRAGVRATFGGIRSPDAPVGKSDQSGLHEPGSPGHGAGSGGGRAMTVGGAPLPGMVAVHRPWFFCGVWCDVKRNTPGRVAFPRPETTPAASERLSPPRPPRPAPVEAERQVVDRPAGLGQALRRRRPSSRASTLGPAPDTKAATPVGAQPASTSGRGRRHGRRAVGLVQPVLRRREQQVGPPGQRQPRAAPPGRPRAPRRRCGTVAGQQAAGRLGRERVRRHEARPPRSSAPARGVRA